MGLTAGIKKQVKLKGQNDDLDLNLPIKLDAGKYEFTIKII